MLPKGKKIANAEWAPTKYDENQKSYYVVRVTPDDPAADGLGAAVAVRRLLLAAVVQPGPITRWLP
jgi:hypothetical protein